MRTGAVPATDLHEQQSHNGSAHEADGHTPAPQESTSQFGPSAPEPRVRLMVPARKGADGQVLVPAHPVDEHPAKTRTGEGAGRNDSELVPARTSADRSLLSGSDEQDEPSTARSVRGATWIDRLEAFLSRLSTRDNFWHRIFSLLFLPLAFWSGIKMRKTGDQEIGDEGGSFAAVLPFTKFNKNWYNAMAGASLLANTEIAGGMYVFGEAGGEHTVVCKNLNYTFLRPCYGPAVYRASPREDLRALIAAGGEFNITLDMDIRQLGVKAGEREKRVGRAEITFHVTPKGHAKVRHTKLKQRDRQRTVMHRTARA